MLGLVEHRVTSPRETPPSPPPPTPAGFVLLHSLASLCLCWCCPNAICAQLSKAIPDCILQEKILFILSQCPSLYMLP